MRLRKNNSILEIMTICLFAAAAWAITLSARAAGPAESLAAEKAPLEAVEEYEVKSGDSLGGIALSRGVAIDDLIEINEIDNPDRINAGTKLVIPGDPKDGVLTKRGVRITVPKGVTLSRIAELYGVSVKKIIRANNISNPDRLRSGQKLLIPGAQKVVELVPPPPCYKDPVELYRLHTQESNKVSLCYCDGKPNPEALEILSRMSGPVRKEMPFPLHPRLLQLLQKVSENYPGKRIEIISGQRTRKNKGHESYHNKGQALDFRVSGVSNKALAQFVRRFKSVGVGYYPNSVFIHLDTRETSAYWIDYSRPGEKAIYGRAGMTKKEIDAIRARRSGAAAKVASGDSIASADATDDAADVSQEQIESESDATIDTREIIEKVVEAAFVEKADMPKEDPAPAAS